MVISSLMTNTMVLRCTLQHEDILPIGDGFIYTVQLVNNDNYKYLDNKYLANGTKVFRKGSARGEYGERFSDIITKSRFP